jgi:hypothetical protein
MTTPNEIAELRKQIDAMSAKLAAMEGAQQSAKSDPNQGTDYVEPRVTVTAVPEHVTADPRMPNEQQLNELIKIVWTQYPRLAPDSVKNTVAGHPHGEFDPSRWDPDTNDENRDWFVRIWFAFRWQLDRLRTDIDITRTIHFHQGLLDEWLCSRNRRDLDGIGLNPMMTALVAAGDIPFMNIDRYFPWCMHLGLVAKGFDGRAAVAQSWQSVLERKNAPQPSLMELQGSHRTTVRETVQLQIQPRS